MRSILSYAVIIVAFVAMFYFVWHFLIKGEPEFKDDIDKYDSLSSELSDRKESRDSTVSVHLESSEAFVVSAYEAGVRRASKHRKERVRKFENEYETISNEDTVLAAIYESALHLGAKLGYRSE